MARKPLYVDDLPAQRVYYPCPACNTKKEPLNEIDDLWVCVECGHHYTTSMSYAILLNCEHEINPLVDYFPALPNKWVLYRFYFKNINELENASKFNLEIRLQLKNVTIVEQTIFKPVSKIQKYIDIRFFGNNRLYCCPVGFQEAAYKAINQTIGNNFVPIQPKREDRYKIYVLET